MENSKYKNLGLRRINKLCKHFGYNKPVEKLEYNGFIGYTISGKYIIDIMFLKSKKKIEIDVYTYGSDIMASYYVDQTVISPTEFYKVYQIVAEYIK